MTAFLLRTAGIALFAAWVAESLAKKQFKRAAVRLLISGIPVLCWNAYVFHVERSPSYTTPAYPYQRAPYLNHNVSYATNLSLEDAYSPAFSKATARQLANRFWQNFLGIGVTLGEAVSESRGYWSYRFHFRGQRYPILKMIPQRLFYIPLILLGGLSSGWDGCSCQAGRSLHTSLYIDLCIVIVRNALAGAVSPLSDPGCSFLAGQSFQLSSGSRDLAANVPAKACPEMRTDCSNDSSGTDYSVQN